mgnify:CR=1 FL=1
MTELKRASYTIKAQKAYYERIKGDTVKHRLYLDKINKKRKDNKERKKEQERLLKEALDNENTLMLNKVKLLIENNKNCIIKIVDGVIELC